MNETMKALLPFLMDAIFKTEVQQYQKQLEQLIEDNDALLGMRTEGFNYLGVNYGRNGWIVRNCPALKLALVPRMSQLHQTLAMMKFDQQGISQTLTRLLQFCSTLQDARDALPECVVALHPILPSMARTRDAGWPLQANTLARHQYEKALIKIQTYCAMKYLY